jgi:hypothetical protein
MGDGERGAGDREWGMGNGERKGRNNITTYFQRKRKMLGGILRKSP